MSHKTYSSYFYWIQVAYERFKFSKKTLLPDNTNHALGEHQPARAENRSHSTGSSQDEALLERKRLNQRNKAKNNLQT